MLKDFDPRVRNEAANAILEFNLLQTASSNNKSTLCTKSTIVTEFVAGILSNEVPFAIGNPVGCLAGFQPSFYLDNNCNRQTMRILGKHLFDITNMLFDLKSNEQLV